MQNSRWGRDEEELATETPFAPGYQPLQNAVLIVTGICHVSYPVGLVRDLRDPSRNEGVWSVLALRPGAFTLIVGDDILEQSFYPIQSIFEGAYTEEF